MNAYDIAHEKMKNALVKIAAAEIEFKNRHVLGTDLQKIQAARVFRSKVQEAIDYSRDAWGV
jgi:hypothetical protein